MQAGSKQHSPILLSLPRTLSCAEYDDVCNASIPGPDDQSPLKLYALDIETIAVPLTGSLSSANRRPYIPRPSISTPSNLQNLFSPSYKSVGSEITTMSSSFRQSTPDDVVGKVLRRAEVAKVSGLQHTPTPGLTR